MSAITQTCATLLDEGTYWCSMSTMHRLLRAHGASGERRRQATHPARKKPELLATKSGQIWSWDITKIRGPGRGIWFQLYVVLDIFSRYVVAWTVQTVEDSEIAKTMLEEAMGVHGIPDAVHADRGTSMTSKPVAQLLLDLGLDGGAHRAARLGLMRTVAEPALLGQRFDIGETAFRKRFLAGRLQLAHARRIDDAAARRNEEQFPVCGGMPAFVISSDFPRFVQFFPKDSVDQG